MKDRDIIKWSAVALFVLVFANPKMQDIINGFFNLDNIRQFIEDVTLVFNEAADRIKSKIPPMGGVGGLFVAAIDFMQGILNFLAGKAAENGKWIPVLILFALLAFVIYTIVSIPLGIPGVPFI